MSRTDIGQRNNEIVNTYNTYIDSPVDVEGDEYEKNDDLKNILEDVHLVNNT